MSHRGEGSGARCTLAARFWGDESGARRALADVGALPQDYEAVPDGALDTTLIVACTPSGVYALGRLLERGVMVRAPDLVQKTTSRAPRSLES